MVFGQPYYVYDGMEEVVDPHAFDGCDMSDVRALYNHDERLVLGRASQTANTLTFSVDATGLYGDILVNPDDPEAMAARARILRGDVDQASFGFEESDVEYVDLPDGRVRRIIRGIAKLYEISVCTFPAYEQTSVAARSGDHAALRREIINHKKSKLRRKLKHHGQT